MLFDQAWVCGFGQFFGFASFICSVGLGWGTCCRRRGWHLVGMIPRAARERPSRMDKLAKAWPKSVTKA